MNWRPYLTPAISVAVLVGLGLVAYATKESWKPLLSKKQDGDTKSKESHDEGGGSERVKLSPQAQANLRLVVEPLVPEDFFRTLLVPGMVIDRPGLSDRSVVTNIAGVLTEVHAQQGDAVKPGTHLFTVRIQSEVVQNSQTELFKTARDLVINKENLDRLQKAGAETVTPARIIELENQDRRLKATLAGYRQELATRGFNAAQIDGVMQGQFVTAIAILAPTTSATPAKVEPVAKSEDPKATPLVAPPALFELKDLKAQLGEQVQVGQLLCTLADHRALYIEGRAFKQESSLLEKATQNGWKIQAEFAEEANAWPPFEAELKIRHLANSVDPTSRTFGFYIPLENQSRTYQSDGQARLVWRFRPGQRVHLKVPTEKYEGVFVLPIDAVVHEGAESYVFRQNGDFFERKPVRVLLEEREIVLLADDGSVGPGQFIARNAASTLNRAIKAQAAGGGGDHGHSHDH